MSVCKLKVIEYFVREKDKVITLFWAEFYGAKRNDDTEMNDFDKKQIFLLFSVK